MSSISLATRTLLRRTAASTGGTLPSAAAVSSPSVRPASTLQETLAEQVPGKQVALASLKKEHGGKVIGNVTIDQLIGGARGVKCMLWETSNLDPEEGIRFRGLTIPECQEVSLRIQRRRKRRKDPSDITKRSGGRQTGPDGTAGTGRQNGGVYGRSEHIHHENESNGRGFRREILRNVPPEYVFSVGSSRRTTARMDPWTNAVRRCDRQSARADARIDGKKRRWR